MQQPAAKYYGMFLDGLLALHNEALANNFLNDKGLDISNIIRGRIYEVQDIKNLETQLDEYNKLKDELAMLEAEGYTDPNSKKGAN